MRGIMGRRGKGLICNIKPSDKECRPLTKCVPDMVDKDGIVLEEKSVELEEKYVHNIYETMAEHFSHTRGIPWPKVKEFVSSFGPGSLILDVGCGNGRFMDCCKESGAIFMGTDRCKSLLGAATNRNSELQVFVDDCMRLHVKSEAFDGIICIAVLHHISTPERRVQAVSELIRCLRKGGTLLIYVWAFEQQQGTVGARKFSSKDSMVPWHFQRKYDKDNTLNKGEEGAEYEDKPNELAPKKKQIVRVSPEKYLIGLQRYYHLFERNEILEICNKGIEHFKSLELCNKAQGCDITIQHVYFDSNNWAVKIGKQ